MVKMDDDALFSGLRDNLFTAVVGDVLDKLGWRRQFCRRPSDHSTGHEDRSGAPCRSSRRTSSMRVPARPALLAANRSGSCWRRWTISPERGLRRNRRIVSLCFVGGTDVDPGGLPAR